jgi:hypothetical protein
MDTKLVELFANRVVERRNMINDYLRGELALRVLGGVDFRGSVDFELLCILSVCFDFEPLLLFLAFSISSSSFFLDLRLFVSFAAFCGFYLVDDLLELCLAFWVF